MKCTRQFAADALMGTQLLAHAAESAPQLTLQDSHFKLSVSATLGVILSLVRADDATHQNFVLAPLDDAKSRIKEAKWLGDISLRYRRTDAAWKSVATWTSASTNLSDDIRQVTADADGSGVTVQYSGDSVAAGGLRGAQLTEHYRLDEDGWHWSITLTNTQDMPLEMGDIAVALPFNDAFNRESDPSMTYTSHVLRHGAIAGDNSFLYWMRADGAGPRLVMTPAVGTHLEYFDQTPSDSPPNAGLYSAYIHALAAARDVEPRGTWTLPLTHALLSVKGMPGDSVTYAFDFHWVADDQAIRDRLVHQGLLDIVVAPSMVIPTDVSALVSIRAASPIGGVEAQYTADTTVERIPSPTPQRTLLRIRFARLGENGVTVHWARGRTSTLEYFVTEPLRTLIGKRAAFLVDKQQVRNPSKWYDGLFSLWDMQQRILRTPEDTGGLDSYMVGGSDDPDLGKAPFIAAKNLRYPDRKQIEALEYYLSHFVWGKLQRTDRETPDPYGIYGVPNWKENRESSLSWGSDGHGQEKMWRAYDYPHLIQLYFTMYRIACAYPDLVSYLDAKGYLDRAYGTARAYFLVPYSIRMDPRTGFPGYNDWAYKLGIYHELYIPQLIDALDESGRHADATWLRGEWEKKVKYFAFDSTYPFGSEMFFDTTAFQSANAFAEYGLDHTLQPDQRLWKDKNSGKWYSHSNVKHQDFKTLMDRSIVANMAARGSMEANYFQLGSDYRGGTMNYLLSYMSQMGGLPILEYGVSEVPNRDAYLRLGYASLMSSWALMNTGTAATDYGYWYRGIGNDGAAGWGYTADKYGPSVFGTNIQQGRGAWRYDGEIDNGYSEAVAGARTIVATDALFGLVAYGGSVERGGDHYTIYVRDGVQQRLSILDSAGRMELTLDRDGFDGGVPVTVALDHSHLSFRLERRSPGVHRTVLSISGLPSGQYVRSADNALVVATGSKLSIAMEVPADGTVELDLRRRSPARVQ